MKMRYLVGIMLFFIAISTKGQLSPSDKLNAIIFEANEVVDMYMPDPTAVEDDCPPKLVRSNTDTLMFFLDALLVDSYEEKEAYLARMMQDNCSPYYQFRILDEHYRPIYADLIAEYSSSTLYAKLPIALSASNPGLRIEGDRAGIWQLSYIIARRYGLNINSLIDERYDVVRSTYAAIQYFMFLESLYPDRPLLVISAFYTSVLYVNKIRSKLSADTDEAFLAAINADLKAFLIQVVSWDEWISNFKGIKKNDPIGKAQKKWKNVEVQDSVEIPLLAEFLGLSAPLLKEMNPIWIGDVITPQTLEYPFYLPDNKADFVEDHYEGFVKFQQDIIDKKEKELRELKKQLADDVPDPSKYMAISYKVRSGDVLGLIAQRNGVKVASIKKWNKLSSDRINIGQELILYVPKSNGGVVKEDEEEVDDVKIEVKNTQPKPGKGAYTTYIVKNGESLWIIARKFPGVSSENIMEWNGISDKIKPGQELKIYGK
jgi:membrane-bound lytic murein transglycosylase D